MIQGLVNARKTQDAITELLTFVLVILISTFVLRFLWNRSLVKHITVLKKLDTFLDAFVMSLALAVVRGI